MNNSLSKALMLFLPVLALFVYSAIAFNRKRAVWSSLLLGGALCLVVVILTHIAEAVHLFPAMGWGEPHSLGHSVDLLSAVGGIVLVAFGIVLRASATQ